MQCKPENVGFRIDFGRKSRGMKNNEFRFTALLIIVIVVKL